jgi:hypothetical protein
MRYLFDKEFVKEMDDFFDYIDYEVLGKPKPKEPKVDVDKKIESLRKKFPGHIVVGGN